MNELPDEIREFAEAFREAFGDGIKLRRVTGAVELGNPKWDQLCRESDNGT